LREDREEEEEWLGLGENGWRVSIAVKRDGASHSSVYKQTIISSGKLKEIR